jgi:excisionase family DNA binding protein
VPILSIITKQSQKHENSARQLIANFYLSTGKVNLYLFDYGFIRHRYQWELPDLMSAKQKTISVSQAAAMCGVGRTTVGYWIRSKKLHALRIGRNYTIPVEDLVFLLKNDHRRIPPELLCTGSSRPIFKSFQNCWEHWSGTEHGRNCRDCIVFRNQMSACFTVKDSRLLGCSGCDNCHYYLEMFLPRTQFVHQIELPAAIFRNLYLWAGNAICADLCGVRQKDLIGMGIEKIVHTASLPKVIEAVRKFAIGNPSPVEHGTIFVNNGSGERQKIHISVYPLQEPAKAFLVLGQPIDFR